MKKNCIVTLCLLFLFILSIVSFLPVPLMGNAAKYAQVGREIIENQNWTELTIGRIPYDQKPPLLFWIGALCFKIFGISIPAYKIFVLIASMLGVFSVFRVGKLFYGKKTGLLSSLFWLTSLGVLHFHNDVHTDTLLASLVVFSVWQYFEHFYNHRFYHFLLGSLGVGLAMLTKGPVGAVIPIVAIGTELIVRKKWTSIFNVKWLLAFFIVALMIAPALLGLWNQFGADGIKFYFWTNNIGRVTGSYHGHSNDYLYYIHTSLYMFLPWTLFVVAAMVFEIKSLINLKRYRVNKDDFPIVIATLVFIGILSVAKQKNPHYLLSAMPFIAFVTGKWTIRFFSRNNFLRFTKILTISNKIVALLAFLFIPVMTCYFFKETRIWFWVIIGSMFFVVCILITQKLNLQKQIVMLLFASSALFFSLNVSLFPNMFKYHTSLHAAMLFNKGKEVGAINLYGKNIRTWNVLLYANRYGKYITSPQELREMLPRGNDWFYTDSKGYDELKKIKDINLTIVKQYNQDKRVSRQSLHFLIPKTRASRFRTAYILKIETKQ